MRGVCFIEIFQMFLIYFLYQTIWYQLGQSQCRVFVNCSDFIICTPSVIGNLLFPKINNASCVIRFSSFVKRFYGLNKATLATGGAFQPGILHILVVLRLFLKPLLYILAFYWTRAVFCKKGPVCFCQFSLCLLKKVHHIYLFQEKQVSVDNPMRRKSRRKTYARFLSPHWIVTVTVPSIWKGIWFAVLSFVVLGCILTWWLSLIRWKSFSLRHDTLAPLSQTASTCLFKIEICTYKLRWSTTELRSWVSRPSLVSSMCSPWDEDFSSLKYFVAVSC